MIYENSFVKIEREVSQIPWVKVFAKQTCKELSQLNAKTREHIFAKAMQIEKAMIDFYKPTKINIASFANYLPQVHLHIMARFEADEFFPEPMWGKAQRVKINLGLKPFSEFELFLLERLS